MAETVAQPLATLFEDDETAWLEEMSRLIADGRHEELDYANLKEYLNDMAIRDRREVMNRLVILIFHLLKWECQPDHRSNSWRATIVHQRRSLKDLLKSRLLRNYAVEALDEAYEGAVEQAAVETGLPESVFLSVSQQSLDELLADG